MDKAMKKAIVLIILVITIPVCCFCVSSEKARFRLKHIINTEDECRVAFWQIGTTNSFPSDNVEITSTAPTRFASLGIYYSGTSKYKISVRNTPLYFYSINENNEKEYNLSFAYPYTLEVLETGSNNILGSPVAGEGNITVGNISTPYSFTVISDDSGLSSTQLHPGNYSLADFRITLGSNDNLPAGNYQGFLLCWVETV